MVGHLPGLSLLTYFLSYIRLTLMLLSLDAI
jgi:hypothetical protein